jgi:hypothetical protein
VAPPPPRNPKPYQKTMLDILLQARGWMAHADLVYRFRQRVLPTSPRSAGVVALAEYILSSLLLSRDVELRQDGKVRVYRYITKGGSFG